MQFHCVPILRESQSARTTKTYLPLVLSRPVRLDSGLQILELREIESRLTARTDYDDFQPDLAAKNQSRQF